MTCEENLFYAGMVAGRLHVAGVKIRPQMEDGRYTGEIDITLEAGLHVVIKVTGFYQEHEE